MICFLQAVVVNIELAILLLLPSDQYWNKYLNKKGCVERRMQSDPKFRN